MARRRLAGVVLALALPWIGPTAGWADTTVSVLRELRDVEVQLLAQVQAQRLANLEAQRSAGTGVSRAAGELVTALQSLADVDAGTEEAEAARLAAEAAETRLLAATIDLDRVVAEGRAIGMRLADHQQRLAALSARLDSADEQVADLDGTWDVVIGPYDDRGTFDLDQQGTLVTGQYRLASGRNGSLTGTFVAGRLQLDQIDAKAGRDATLHGVLSQDASALRGTWEARILGTGRPGFGSWSGAKRARTGSTPPAATDTP